MSLIDMCIEKLYKLIFFKFHILSSSILFGTLYRVLTQSKQKYRYVLWKGKRVLGILRSFLDVSKSSIPWYTARNSNKKVFFLNQKLKCSSLFIQRNFKIIGRSSKTSVTVVNSTQFLSSKFLGISWNWDLCGLLIYKLLQ